MLKNKYLKLFISFMIGLTMFGCGVKEDGMGLTGDGSGQEEIVSDNMIAEQPGTDEQLSFYSDTIAYSEKSILDVENGGKIIYQAEDDEQIVSVAASEDTVYVTIYEYDGTKVGHDRSYKIIAIDRTESSDGLASENNNSLEIIEELYGYYSDPKLGYYNNTLYVSYTKSVEYSVGNTYYYTYIKGDDGEGYIKGSDNLSQSFSRWDVLDQRFCGDFSSCIQSLNECGLMAMWNKDLSVVYIYDGDGHFIRNFSIDPSVFTIALMDDGLLITRGQGNYYMYELTGADDEPVAVIETDEYYDFLAVDDGYIYYYIREAINSYTYTNHRYFYRYRIGSGENTLLYETDRVTGQPANTNGVNGFTVVDGKCYYLSFEDGALWWFSCDCADENYMAARMEMADDYNGIYDMTSIEVERDVFTCEICGYEYTYGFVTAQLNDSEIPFAEQINETLRELTQVYVDRAVNYIENHRNGDWHDYASVMTNSVFDGVTVYTFEVEGEETEFMCLEVDYSGSVGRLRYLFNLQDGSMITVGDICGISKEDLCELIAEYTVEDFKDDKSGYKYGTEERIYEEAYAYAEENYAQYIRMGPDGVVIEYSQMSMTLPGDRIEVIIPYEALGLRLIEIHGSNESPVYISNAGINH